MKLKKIVILLFCILLAGSALDFAGTSAVAQEDLSIPRIYFNTASAKRLAKSPGITDALAKEIVTYRIRCGYFKDLEDLLRVPGITKEVYEKINPRVSPEGYLYCIPEKGIEFDDENEDEPILSPSKPLC